jgi:sRNA-binding regulator protein Hfq
MPIHDPLAPPKEFLRELARADDRRDERRREGRAATTSPSKPPASSSGTSVAIAAPMPPKSVAALVNTPVTLYLRNGAQLQGVLAAVWQYEFVVRIADGGFVIILKHSVDMLEPAGKA